MNDERGCLTKVGVLVCLWAKLRRPAGRSIPECILSYARDNGQNFSSHDNSTKATAKYEKL